MGSIHITQDRDQWRTVVYTVMNPRVSQKAVTILTSGGIVSLLHGISWSVSVNRVRVSAVWSAEQVALFDFFLQRFVWLEVAIFDFVSAVLFCVVVKLGIFYENNSNLRFFRVSGFPEI